MITLHYSDTTIDIQESDASYRYRALMEKPQLVLKFSLPTYIEFPVGTWCVYQNEVYSVWSPQNIKKNGERNIEYTLTMGNEEQLMAITKLRNSVDNRLKFSMCAKPSEFVEEIVKSLNAKEGGNSWSVGDCIESTEKTIEFNHSYIDAALQSVADTFETEWEIVNKQISLHKVEYFKEDPLPLSYGKGNGFVPGLGRTTPSGEMPVKRLYVQGGDKNIDPSKYGSAELLLPKGKTLEYEGRTYKSDAKGLYIERADQISDAVKEDSLDCSEIYPSRIGTVSSVECIDQDKHFYDFIDSSIPDNLNFNDYIIEGETATVIFQSGMLAGKEFEFKYKHEKRRFELVPQEIDGQTMPNETYKPCAGGVKPDTYAVFGIMLPGSYICNDADQTGASWDMFREAARYLYENEEQKFTFTGTLQGLWAKRNWLKVGGRLKVGGYINFSDTQFAKEGEKIRIVGIKDFLYAPYSPTIEISNAVSGSSIASQLREIENQEVVIDDAKKSILQFTKRRFRDAKETLGMIEKSMLDFSSSVNPITVQTMAMLVGDESLQFRFVASRESLVVDNSFHVTYDSKNKQLHCPHSFLQHMTLGITSISSSHAKNEYKVWEMEEYLSPVLTDPDKKYYLYAQVSRSDTSVKGRFTLSETAIDMNGIEGCYMLLVGVLNSENEDTRSYVDLYGFTEVLPGRVTTDRIVSGDGQSYFDMVANAMKLGDVLDFNSQGDGKLKLTGTIIQRGGVEQPIVMYRGQWSASEAYYVNDVVFATNTDTGVTSSYICIRQTTAGIAVTDTEYWSVFAEGVKGADGMNGADGADGTDGADGKNGNTTYYIYTLSNTTPATPAFLNPAAIAAPWSRTPQEPTETEHIYMSQSVLSGSTGVFGPWTTPIRISGADGKAGKDGSDIEFIYKLTSGAAPSTPASVNTDDYVPSGWTDNPSGVSQTNTHEWISVRHKNAGETTWGSFSTPALWSKWGEKGQDGDGVEYIFKLCEVETVLESPASVDTDGYVPSGWTDNPSGVSDEYPFEYVSVRRSSNGVWGAFSTPQIWAKYDVLHTNILEQTEFESASKLDKWSTKSFYYGGHEDDAYTHIRTGGKNGANYYSDVNTRIYSNSQYKDVLAQKLTGGGISKLQGSTWYTLSFWARCMANYVHPSPNSTSGYLLGTWNLYLFAGSSYKLSVYGFIDSTALNNGKCLRAYIYKEDSSGTWTWSKFVDIRSTTGVFAYIELSESDITVTGEYKLGFYQFPNGGTMGTVTVSFFKLEKQTDVYSTFLYPSLIDTTKMFVDGKQVSPLSDACVHYPISSEWTKHCITFKTQSYLSSYDNRYVLFRLRPTPVEGMQSMLDICMPKLEIGKIATDYVPNASDMHTTYQEYRFAKNGSASVAPSLDNTANDPSGWTVTQPEVGALEYLWMIVGNKKSDGTLISTWSTPVRVTPKDGVNGKSPVLVYRGVYNSTKTYYGTPLRVDAVKYNNTYWVAAIDAGEIKGVAPSSTSSKWNTFGAQFESVATNLLLAENANIGDWFMSGGKIVSTLSESDKIELDAASKTIKITSTKSGGDYSTETTKGSVINLDAENGVIEARNSQDKTKVAYISQNGIFANQAGTRFTLYTQGADRRAAIVGMGYANLDNNLSGQNAIAGVYGFSSNSGTAPAYGGFFEELMACGFVGNMKILSGSTNENYYIQETDTIIIGMSSVQQSVYLLPTTKQGKTFLIKNVGAGTISIYPRNTTSLNYKLFTNATPQDSYYNITNGQYAIAHYCGIVTYGGNDVGMWAITRI